MAAPTGPGSLCFKQGEKGHLWIHLRVSPWPWYEKGKRLLQFFNCQSLKVGLQREGPMTIITVKIQLFLYLPGSSLTYTSSVWFMNETVKKKKNEMPTYFKHILSKCTTKNTQQSTQFKNTHNPNNYSVNTCTIQTHTVHNLSFDTIQMPTPYTRK